MSALEVHNLRKTFGSYSAIRGADLTLQEGEFVTLLGESGCGKTTTLRSIAGLETPDDGYISIKSDVVFDYSRRVNAPPERRKTGMVFQSYALWPHMTVLETVVYPLRMRGADRREARSDALAILRTVGLENLAQRPATSLSGGQQQRVALARALVSKPQLMLYDEPLSNLDPSLRRMMRDEILRLHRLNGTTSLYVTHDLEEAMHLSDRVIVMQSGLLEQGGTPEEIYTKPANEFVVRFVGFENILPAVVLDDARDRLTVQLAETDCVLSVPRPGFSPARGASVSLAFRAANVSLLPARGSNGPGSSLRATIASAVYLGARIEYEAVVGPLSVRIVQTENAVLLYGGAAREGDQVDLLINPLLCAVVPVVNEGPASVGYPELADSDSPPALTFTL